MLGNISYVLVAWQVVVSSKSEVKDTLAPSSLHHFPFLEHRGFLPIGTPHLRERPDTDGD